MGLSAAASRAGGPRGSGGGARGRRGPAEGLVGGSGVGAAALPALSEVSVVTHNRPATCCAQVPQGKGHEVVGERPALLPDASYK